MDVKTSFFDVMSEVKNIHKTFLRNRSILNNLIYMKFVQTMMSKLARSTLTLPGRIRDNCNYITIIGTRHKWTSKIATEICRKWCSDQIVIYE